MFANFFPVNIGLLYELYNITGSRKKKNTLTTKIFLIHYYGDKKSTHKNRSWFLCDSKTGFTIDCIVSLDNSFNLGLLQDSHLQKGHCNLNYQQL